MKKFIAIIISITLCLTLISCDNSNVSSEDDSVNTSATQLNDSLNNTETKGTSKLTVSAKKSDTTTDKAGVTATKPDKATVTKGETTKNETTKSNTTVNTTSKKHTANEVATKKPTVTAKPTNSATISCSIKIECISILSNMDKLKAGHEAYVPSNGIILGTSSLTVKNGSTAYDALKTACDNNGISLNITNSSYGKYIAGINYIDEKDCGKYSGWMYKVNDSFPNTSVDKYILKNGDNIVFSYTCGNNK